MPSLNKGPTSLACVKLREKEKEREREGSASLGFLHFLNQLQCFKRFRIASKLGVDLNDDRVAMFSLQKASNMKFS